MTLSTQKIRVQTLRKEGMTFTEIAEVLGVRKTSSFGKWCKDIELSSLQRKKLEEKKREKALAGSKKFVEKLREQKEISRQLLRREGVEEIGRVNRRELFLCGIAMYWSEGYTYEGGEQVGFTNSDPRMILFMLRWFQEICKISLTQIILQIKINELHKERLKQIEQYWSEIIDIPLSQFTRTTLIKTKVKKTYPNPEDYFGTLRITIKKGSLLRRKIHGWIEGLGLNSKHAELPA